MKQIIQKIRTNDEKDAWQFFGQICEIQDAIVLYMEGKATERRLMISLLGSLLKMDGICKRTLERVAKEKRSEIVKEGLEKIERLVREKHG
jgi:hypothetical protein